LKRFRAARRPSILTLVTDILLFVRAIFTVPFAQVRRTAFHNFMVAKGSQAPRLEKYIF
jgi:hypothetical protein